MKAFKGCINPNCVGYKKIKYKKDDEFCKKCGDKLSFVCADCWKPMDDDEHRLCINCKAKQDQAKADKKAAIKQGGAKVIAAVGVAAVAAPKVVKGVGGLAKDAKGAVGAFKDLAKMIVKK